MGESLINIVLRIIPDEVPECEPCMDFRDGHNEGEDTVFPSNSPEGSLPQGHLVAVVIVIINRVPVFEMGTGTFTYCTRVSN